MFGHHGRYLRIDVGDGSAILRALSEAVLQDFLGGVGLGAWILAHEAPAGADPLGPEAALVVALSPLVGSPLTTSAKFAVAAISPLTGRFCDALSSSHFALAAKRSGVDALAIVGAAARPSILLIDGQGRSEPAISLRDAGDLWSQPASQAERRLRQELGPDWQVAAIGPAGERRIPFATISHDGRHAGRGGLGAVLGAKRIKAVAVRGDRRTPLADPARAVVLARDLSARSFGPATAKYRELGTVANLLVFNRFQTLPTRNFASGSFEGAGRLAGDDLGASRRIARRSCAACTIGCEHIHDVPGRDGGVRLEYESLFALGPLCGIDDPAIVAWAAAACDDQGIDTISTGGTIAFAMACVEHGLIDGRLPGSGRTLRFGDGPALLEAIEALARRDGDLGALLALGSRAAAEQIGGEATSLAMHVKGLELPGYDPRKLPAMALGLAVGTRGADHNRSGAYEADFAEHPRPRSAESIAADAIASEDRSALLDSLILCKFLRGVFGDLHEESAAMLAAVTGQDGSADDLLLAARRIVSARKCLNQREGWTRAEDALPARLLRDGPLTSADLDATIAAYYRGRGWGDDGRVPDSLRAALGLDDPAFGTPSR